MYTGHKCEVCSGRMPENCNAIWVDIEQRRPLGACPGIGVFKIFYDCRSIPHPFCGQDASLYVLVEKCNDLGICILNLWVIHPLVPGGFKHVPPIWVCDELVLNPLLFQCYSGTELVFGLRQGRTTPIIIFTDNTYHYADLQRTGINRRIDWPNASGESRNNYAVVITPKGRASYYEFANVKEGETTKPTSYLNCREPQ